MLKFKNRLQEKIFHKNLSKFLEKKYINNILNLLNDGNIKYGIFAGSQVSLITSTRKPTDIDIMIANNDFGKLVDLLKGKDIEIGEKISDKSEVKIESKMINLNDIEFISNLKIFKEGKAYNLYLTELVWKYTHKFHEHGLDISMLPIEDTILIKKMLNRGKDQGKFDKEDIAAVKSMVELNNSYIKKRINEIGLDNKIQI